MAVCAQAQLVTLEPGEGLILPSGAYHAPAAKSFDSLSLNTFLVDGPPLNQHHVMDVPLSNFLFEFNLKMASNYKHALDPESNHYHHSLHCPTPSPVSSPSPDHGMLSRSTS